MEEIDVVCLNSLARCGICPCMDVSSTAVTLLSRWVRFQQMSSTGRLDHRLYLGGIHQLIGQLP